MPGFLRCQEGRIREDCGKMPAEENACGGMRKCLQQTERFVAYN